MTINNSFNNQKTYQHLYTYFPVSFSCLSGCGMSCNDCSCGDNQIEPPKEEVKPVCDHEWVNAGFISIKMVCKKCNVEKPE